MKINNSPQKQRTGHPQGPVPLLLLLISLCALALSVSAQTADKNYVSDSVLGVSIGSSLADAHLKLDPLGTNGGRDTRGGGRKESWILESTGYSAVALKTNGKGEVVWITGFVRSGQEIPFATLGELTGSTRSNESEAIWNVETKEGGYRLVVKGQNGKANVVYLLSLEAPPVE